MKNTPLISVMLPVYKGFALSKSIQSILDQTYADFELIILNDCSPDNVEGIIQSFKDPRIRYFCNEENMGKNNLVGVWNKLLSLSRGEFGVIAGDDDIYEKDYLQEMIDLSRKYPSVDLFHSPVNIINSNDEITGKSSPCPEFEKQGSFIYERRVNRRIQFAPEFFFRIEKLRDFGGFVSFPLAWLSDDATWYQLAENGCVTSSRYLVSWRHSGVNISSKVDNYKEKVFAAECYSDWMRKFLFSERYDGSLSDAAFQRLLSSTDNAAKRTFLHIFRTTTWRFAFKMMQDHEVCNSLKLSKVKLFADKLSFRLLRKLDTHPDIRKFAEKMCVFYSI